MEGRACQGLSSLMDGAGRGLSLLSSCQGEETRRGGMGHVDTPARNVVITILMASPIALQLRAQEIELVRLTIISF